MAAFHRNEWQGLIQIIQPSKKVCLYDKNTHTENWKSVTIAEDLKIAVNKSAGIELVALKAALVGKIRSIDKDETLDSAAYSLLEEEPKVPFDDSYVFCHHYFSIVRNVFLKEYLGYSIEDKNAYKNETFRFLNDKIYILSNIDSAGFAEFSTPLIDVETFKNTTFTVREETDISIKLYAEFKATDPNADNTPIIIWNTYKLSQETENDNSSDLPFPFTTIQLNNADIIEGKYKEFPNDRLTIIKDKNLISGTYSNWSVATQGNVVINAEENVSMNAYHSINLTAGTNITVNEGGEFNARLISNSYITNTSYSSLNNIVNEYFGTCNSSLKSTEMDEQLIELPKEQFVYVTSAFPNPVVDRIKIISNLKEDETAIIEIYNSLGSLIFAKETFNQEEYIDLSDKQSGIYLLRVVRNCNIFTKKILKK